MKLHRDDLVEATLAWVTGKVYESIFGTNLYRSTFITDGVLDERKVQDFIHRTHTVVWRYLNRQQTLDGRCSDFECNLGLEADRIFAHHFQEQQT